MKIVHMWGTMGLKMSTYIIGFCLMDCGPIASGLAFNGDVMDPKHDRVKNVIITGLVFTSKVKYFLSCWNISTHEWLKNYVFMRMLDNKKRSGATKAALVTFMVSAIWHGFYPGFISFFLGAFLMDKHQKVAHSFCGPVFKGWCPDIVQNLGIVVFYYVCCSYNAVAFWLLNFNDFNRVYADMYYAGHVVIIGSLLVMMAF